MTYRLHKPWKKYILPLRHLHYAAFVFKEGIIMYKYFVVLRGYIGYSHAIFVWFLYFNVHIIERRKPAMHFYKWGSFTYTFYKRGSFTYNYLRVHKVASNLKSTFETRFTGSFYRVNSLLIRYCTEYRKLVLIQKLNISTRSKIFSISVDILNFCNHKII